jgi:thiol-disulfide isomerase/thioredoxin
MKTKFVRWIVAVPALLGAFASGAAAETVEEAFPGLAMNVLASAELVSMAPTVLLTAEDVEIRTSEIDEILDRVVPEMRPKLERNLFFLLEQEAAKRILPRLAEADGISPEAGNESAAIHAFLDRRAGDVSVSEAEARAFYESNREMVGGMPFEPVRDSIVEFLVNQKKQTAKDEYLAALGRTAGIRVNRAWAEARHEIVRDNPVDRARASGKPTLVEFGATGCVPCDMMQPILENIRKKYGDRINVVFVHVGEDQFLGARFGIRSIPVQVFYDEDGNEAFRHSGFYPEAEIVKQFEKLGVR